MPAVVGYPGRSRSSCMLLILWLFERDDIFGRHSAFKFNWLNENRVFGILLILKPAGVLAKDTNKDSIFNKFFCGFYVTDCNQMSIPG